MIAKQTMNAKKEARAGQATDYLTRLSQVAAVMSERAPSQKHLHGILKAATEIADALCAWLYVPSSQLSVLSLSEATAEQSAELEIGPKARLVSSGPIAEAILKCRGQQRPAFSEDRTELILPLPQGGMMIRTAKRDGWQDPSLYLALQMLANMATSVLLNADEQNEALSRARHLERMHQELLNKNMELRERSMIDDLTGLYNRRFFQRSLAYEIDRFSRYRHPLGVILFDVDHFKKINDLFGHSEGDRALKHLADVAKQTVRSADLLARYGGEEFVVLLPDTNIDGAAITGERLRIAVQSSPFETDGAKVQVTISAGLTALDREFTGDADQLMRSVDHALYKAKFAGRNQVAVARV